MKLLVNGISNYGPGHPIGPACWPHHDLIVVLEGSVELRCGGRRHDLRAHDVLLVPPRLPFAGAMGAQGGVIWVQHFRAARGELPAGLGRAPGPRWLRQAATSELALALLRKIHALREGNPEMVESLRQSLFASLLLELAHGERAAATAGGEASRLQAAVGWAEGNLREVGGLGDVARRAGLSESHFRSVFRRLRGQAAGRWLRERRMAEARQHLSSTGRTLKEISAELGFSDAVSFSRSFRKFHGLPPGAYRRLHPRAV